jgi:hypothetical protein
MMVELKPEQEELIREQLAGGQFKSVEEVLTIACPGFPAAADPIAMLLRG